MSRCIAKIMHLDLLKRPTIWNEGVHGLISRQLRVGGISRFTQRAHHHHHGSTWARDQSGSCSSSTLTLPSPSSKQRLSSSVWPDASSKHPSPRNITSMFTLVHRHREPRHHGGASHSCLDRQNHPTARPSLAAPPEQHRKRRTDWAVVWFHATVHLSTDSGFTATWIENAIHFVRAKLIHHRRSMTSGVQD